MGVLLAAEEWGVPPWEIAGGARVTWYLRWVEYHNMRTAKANHKGQSL